MTFVRSAVYLMGLMLFVLVISTEGGPINNKVDKTFSHNTKYLAQAILLTNEKLNKNDIYDKVMAVWKKGIHMDLEKDGIAVTSEQYDRVFHDVMKKDEQKIKEEVDKVVEENQKHSLRSMASTPPGSSSDDCQIPEIHQIQPRNSTLVQGMAIVVKYLTRAVLIAGNENLSKNDIHDKVIAVLKNISGDTIKEAKQEELASNDDVFPCFMETYGKEVNNEIDNVIDENKRKTNK
uniref:Uncharacterized protein n=1 Tax=Cacopsylla melanoneura TaxID=428564 RepID=A0A8D8T294_9HEMI